MKYNHHHTMELMYASYRAENKKEKGTQSINILAPTPTRRDPPEPPSPSSNASDRFYYLEKVGFSRKAGKAAYLSSLVYEDNADNPQDFKYDKKLSEKNARGGVRGSVFEDDETGDIYLVYKGTDPTDPRDLAADVMIGLGTEEYTQRYKYSVDQLLRTQEKYPDRKIYLAGHSLGSQLASRVGHNYKVDGVYNFNRGSSVFVDESRAMNEGKSKSKQYHFRNSFDVISTGDFVSRPNEKFYTIKSKTGRGKGRGLPLASHSMNNFVFKNPEYQKEEDRNYKKINKHQFGLQTGYDALKTYKMAEGAYEIIKGFV